MDFGNQQPIYILLHTVLWGTGILHNSMCIQVWVVEGGPGCQQYFNRPDSHTLQTDSLLPKSQLRLRNKVQRSIIHLSQRHTSPLSAPVLCSQIFLFVCLAQEENEEEEWALNASEIPSGLGTQWSNQLNGSTGSRAAATASVTVN